jgi:minor extracellular protease Epr
VHYPARYDSIIAVSATNEYDQLANFSNYGDEVTVAGPGQLVTSVMPGGIPATRSGTSYAAPHVSGTLALILSIDPSLNANQAVEVLKESVTNQGDLEVTEQFGSGIIDAYQSVVLAGQ